MGLADIARAKQIQKQLDRLQSAQDAEERDRHAYKFATYQGKDPVDGTDIVEVDGVKTSGFKLMSNAPLSIGDRVNLRPNQQGLQRVDAKNVAPVIPIDEPVIEDIFVKILFLDNNKLYIGGDRKTPKLIYEAPAGYVINYDASDNMGGNGRSIILNNYGIKKNDWICQFFIRTTASIPIFFSGFDPALNHEQIFYDTFTYTYIVLNHTGVMYSKDFDYAHLQGDQIYLGVGGAQALSRSIAGGYGYVGLTGLMGKLDNAGQLEDTSFNPIFDPDNGDPIYGFGQWQTFVINSVTDAFLPVQNKNLYAFSFDATRTDILDIALFDNPSESRLVYLETFGSEYYYGTFGRLLTMGKNQNDCLLFRRSGGDFFADWYTAGNPIPISIPYTFAIDLEGKYSPNHIGNNIYTSSSVVPSSTAIINIKLNIDATVEIKSKRYKHLGFGQFTDLEVVDVSFSP